MFHKLTRKSMTSFSIFFSLFQWINLSITVLCWSVSRWRFPIVSQLFSKVWWTNSGLITKVYWLTMYLLPSFRYIYNIQIRWIILSKTDPPWSNDLKYQILPWYSVLAKMLCITLDQEQSVYARTELRTENGYVYMYIHWSTWPRLLMFYPQLELQHILT